jgi:membrane fusion protein, multidrug efflux system
MHKYIRRFRYLLLAASMLPVSCSNKKQEAAPYPEITVVETLQKDVPIYREFIGEIFGEKDIPIRARVEGFLEGIFFTEGAQVLKGQLLYTIDPRPLEAKVNAKKSEVAEAETMVTKALNDLNRYKPLAEINAVSKSELDAAQAQYDVSLSALEAAKANLESTRIELGYTRIMSPISGIIGISQAKTGDFVGRDPNPVILNTVSATENVKVRFYLTESEYLFSARHIADKMESGEQDESASDNEPNIELILSDGSLYEYKGTGDFIDRNIDPNTGSILVQTSFPNPDLLLRPGMYARVKMVTRLARDGILIPLRCLMELQDQQSVFLVGPDNKIESRSVTTGPVIGDYILITGGLEAGDKVVIDALQKVRTGMVINPKLIGFDSKTHPEI